MFDTMERLQKSISREEIDKLPLFSYTGPITVIETPQDAQAAGGKLRLYPFLGFDTETRPAFHKGECHNVALLQLAVPDNVYLFRLNKCGFCDSLRQLLEDQGVFKIGVGIRDDLRNLKKEHQLSPNSFIDLQDYAEKFDITDKAFSKLMAIIFRVRISKRQRVTNWEAAQLTEAQIRYAATDAWGALKMYERLSSYL